MNNVENVEKVNSLPSKKQVLALMAVLLCCALCFIAVCGLEDSRVIEVKDISITENTQINCSIDGVTMGEHIVFDSCHAFLPEENIEAWDVSIVLRPVGSSGGLLIPTYMLDSVADYKTYTQIEGNFDRTHFGANVAADKLSLATTEYDILLYYNNNHRDIYVDTGRKLTQEGLK